MGSEKNPFFVINICMKQIATDQIYFNIKRLFKAQKSFYLRLSFYADGSWTLDERSDIATCLTVNDWRHLRRWHKHKIKKAQRHIINRIFITPTMKSIRTPDYSKLYISKKECLDIIERDYNLIFEGKI